MPNSQIAEPATGQIRAKNNRGKGAKPRLKNSTLGTRTSAVRSPFLRIGQLVFQAVENRRLLILLPFVIIAGILFYCASAFEPNSIALTIGALLSLVALFIWRASASLMPAIFLFCGFWLGFSLLSIHGALFGSEMMYGSFFGQYSARVDAVHSNDSERARIIISNISPLDDRRAPPVRRARILLPSDQLPKIGDVISASLRLYRVPGPVTPGGFDSQFHAYFEGIGAFGSATSEVLIIDTNGQANFSRWVQEIRNTIGTRIDAALPPPISGIARALIIGDQGQVDDAIRSNLAGAGLAHVLAISGLHLSLVAGGVFAAIRMALAASYVLGQKTNVKKLAALGGMAAALIYLGLSGASVSAVRATLMLMLIFGAVLAGRKALTMRNVALAALFVIVTDPASIFRPSFQLSFAAVTALVGAYEGYTPFVSTSQNWGSKMWRVILGIALTSLIAGAATALFAAYHFQQIAPLGVLGNIIAIPMVSLVILPAALIGVLLMPFGFEGVFLSVMGWGIERIIEVANYIASIGTAGLNAPILGASALLFGLAGLAWFAFFPGRERFVGVAVAAVLVVFFGPMSPPDILVADTTHALAVRTGTSLELVAGRQNSFAVRVWNETYLEPIVSPEGVKPCDGSGCFYHTDDFKLALIKSIDAFGEDCALADIVITRIDAPASCAKNTQVIDATDLRVGGVHWLKWTGTDFLVRPAMTDIHRPWRAQFPR